MNNSAFVWYVTFTSQMYTCGLGKKMLWVEKVPVISKIGLNSFGIEWKLGNVNSINVFIKDSLRESSVTRILLQFDSENKFNMSKQDLFEEKVKLRTLNDVLYSLLLYYSCGLIATQHIPNLQLRILHRHRHLLSYTT